jgi:cobalt/nickel transport system permease protein
MLLIDKYAYFNRLRDVHPLEKATLSLVLLIFALVVKDPLVSLTTFLVMSAFTIFSAKIPPAYYLKLLLLPVFFLLSGMITILLSITDGQTSASQIIWYTNIGDWQIYISESSLHQVVDLFFVVLGSVGCLYFLTLTTPITAIVGLLHKMRLSPLLIDLIIITYRFIFVFLETASTIHQAQSSRLGYISIRRGIKSLGQLISTLFLKASHRGYQLSVAMDSRGYTNEVMLLEKSYSYSSRNWFLITGIFTAMVFIYVQFGGIF